MSVRSSLIFKVKKRFRACSASVVMALSLSLCGYGLLGTQSVEARLNYNHAAYMCSTPNSQISKEAAQAFNDGWFLTISNFRSRRGEALELLEKAQAADHPYARVALLYLRAKILNQTFPYAENQFDLIPILVGDDPLGITLAAQTIAVSTDFLSKNPGNAERLMRALDRAIAAGYASAYYVKGRLLMMLDHKQTGLELIFKGAEKGHAVAKHHIAALSIHGLLDFSEQEAFEMLESSVQDGDLSALQDLAYCYEKGFGVKQDLDQALKLYKKSMEHGDAGAALALARLQLMGEQPDYVEAFVALNFAYNNNKPEAANALGYLYMSGLGVKQDKSLGFSLMEQAAKAGDITAIENMISCYTYGNGVMPNQAKVDFYQEQLRNLHATQVAVQK